MKKRVCALFTALLLTLSCAVAAETPANARTIGPFAVVCDGTGVTLTADKTMLTITGSEPVALSAKNTVIGATVCLDAPEGVTLTLDGLDVDNSGKKLPALLITEDCGPVVLQLRGDCTLKGGAERAAIEKTNDAPLTITSAAGNGSVDGLLIAMGQKGGAAIGGAAGQSARNITLAGGTITASSTDGAAAVGGGVGGSGSGITVTGGLLTLDSHSAAAIGGGTGGDGYHIAILGGDVTCNGKFGIGGERFYDFVMGGGSLKANGTVSALGGNLGYPEAEEGETLYHDILLAGGVARLSGGDFGIGNLKGFWGTVRLIGGDIAIQGKTAAIHLLGTQSSLTHDTAKLTTPAGGKVSFDANTTATTVVDKKGGTVLSVAFSGKNQPIPEREEEKPEEPPITTTEQKNEDGSVTVTVTDHTTGTVTKTTTRPDGTTVREVILTDDTITILTTPADGSVCWETLIRQGRVVSHTVTLGQNWNGTALPLPALTPYPADQRQKAPLLILRTGREETVRVAVDLVVQTPSTVVSRVPEDGGEEIVKTCFLTDTSIVFPARDGEQFRIWENPKYFEDAASHWAADSIAFVTSRELFSGMTETDFQPESPMTRAMLWTVLARMEGVDTTPAEGTIWYAPGRTWSMDSGISDGTDPDLSITREQLVTMLWRYRGCPEPTGTLEGFEDADQVQSYARTAMAWAVETGLVTGITPTTLAPATPAYRCQLAVIFQRFCAL